MLTVPGENLILNYYLYLILKCANYIFGNLAGISILATAKGIFDKAIWGRRGGGGLTPHWALAGAYN